MSFVMCLFCVVCMHVDELLWPRDEITAVRTFSPLGSEFYASAPLANANDFEVCDGLLVQ